MNRLVPVLAIAALVPIAVASAAAAKPRASLTPTVSAAPRVALQPAVARLGEEATITVAGVHARAVEVRLAATDIVGERSRGVRSPGSTAPGSARCRRRPCSVSTRCSSARAPAALCSGRNRCSSVSFSLALVRGLRSRTPSTWRAGGWEPFRTRRSSRSKRGPSRRSIDATRACTACSSSRTALRDTPR